jgi:predicted secreted protein
MRRILIFSLALALGACGYVSPDRTGGDPGPDRTAELDNMTDPDDWKPPEMPSEAEAAAAAAAAQAQAQADVIYAGAASKGGSVTVPPGKTLRIELVSVPTAGYVWEITAQPDFLELTGEAARPTDPAVQNLPGFTGGDHYLSFDFRAVSAGTGMIELAERRPWESDEPPMDTYTLTVTAAAAE